MSLNEKEIKRLMDLAKKLKEKSKSRNTAMASFVSAGILTKKGAFTKPYRSLKAVVTES